MRARAILCTAAVVSVAGGLAWTRFGRRHGAGPCVLEVPATYLSVGQQFQPRLVSLDPTPDGATSDVELELQDASGRTVATAAADLPDGGTLEAPPMSLPHAGGFLLRMHTDAGADASLHLEALPEPPANIGGVTPLASFGLSEGASDYLRQHSFAVQPFPVGPAAGDEAPVAAERLIVVGDARGAGEDLIPAYSRIWSQVAAGTGLLLLESPPPGVANFWPTLGPLAAPEGDCQQDFNDAGLGGGLSPGDAGDALRLLRPTLVYDLAGQRSLDLYRWDGVRLPRANPQSGYPGCHAVFSYRYGYGWVTVSTLPLLEHFQDARARIVLMNLIVAALRRKHAVPASPGLAWVTRQRLQAMAKLPPAPLRTDAAVYFRPAPTDAAEPAATLLPLPESGAGCWTSPPAAPGATVVLDLRPAQPAHGLSLDFGAEARRWPQFHLEASPDDMRWQTLPVPAASDGRVNLALPAGAWRDFRLTLTAPAAAGFRLCGFAAQ